MRFEISSREYAQRLEYIRKLMAERDLDAFYVTKWQRIFYLTGYHCWATRPMGCLITQDTITHFIPIMEKQRLTE